jgi:nicotinic acid mononucleotide adenylyltransferase
VHYGHVELLTLARDHCAAQGEHVLACLIQPSPSTKLALKNGVDAISDEHRLAMLRLMLEAHPALTLLAGESKAELRTRLAAHLAAHYQRPVELRMPSVCGPENLLAIKSKHIYLEGVLCVHSRAVPMDVSALLARHRHRHCIQLVAGADLTLYRSSSLIRAAVRDFYQGTLDLAALQTRLSVWTAPSVIAYIIEHRLWY